MKRVRQATNSETALGCRRGVEIAFLTMADGALRLLFFGVPRGEHQGAQRQEETHDDGNPTERRHQAPGHCNACQQNKNFHDAAMMQRSGFLVCDSFHKTGHAKKAFELQLDGSIFKRELRFKFSFLASAQAMSASRRRPDGPGEAPLNRRASLKPRCPIPPAQRPGSCRASRRRAPCRA